MNLIKLLYPGLPEGFNPFGCLPETPHPEAPVYNRIFAGGSARTVSKNWLPYLPTPEKQMWPPFCVSFSRLNCAETKANYLGVKIDFSDVELAIGSGTTQAGNTMDKVDSYFRNIGIRTQNDFPFTDEMKVPGAWDKMVLTPNTGQRIYQGGDSSWVFGISMMIDALDHSTLQIAVPVGETWEDNIVKPIPASHIQFFHAVEVYYIDANYIYILDTIGKPLKKLSLDYPISGCKSFRDLPENWKDQPMITFVHITGTKEFAFLETTPFTQVIHRGISEADIKFMATKFGVQVLNPDGSINFAGAREMSLPEPE